MRIPLTLILVALPLMAAQSQDDLSGDVSKPRRFAVEVIIFRYAQDVSTGSEIFPGDGPDVGQSISESEPASVDAEPLEEIPRFYRSIEFEKMPQDQYTLDDILGRLRRLDVYEPLMHFGWTQLTWPDEDTRPIELGVMGRPPADLNGTLRLYLGRFLHLVVDLELDAPQATDTRNAVSSYGDYRSLNDSADPARTATVGYRISEDRILRSGELRYFDHPKFGVLAKVTRMEDTSEPAPEAVQDGGETELLGYPPE